jgi:hypothetical protein
MWVLDTLMCQVQYFIPKQWKILLYMTWGYLLSNIVIGLNLDGFNTTIPYDTTIDLG